MCVRDSGEREHATRGSAAPRSINGRERNHPGRHATLAACFTLELGEVSPRSQRPGALRRSFFRPSDAATEKANLPYLASPMGRRGLGAPCLATKGLPRPGSRSIPEVRSFLRESSYLC